MSHLRWLRFAAETVRAGDREASPGIQQWPSYKSTITSTMRHDAAPETPPKYRNDAEMNQVGK